VHAQFNGYKGREEKPGFSLSGLVLYSPKKDEGLPGEISESPSQVNTLLVD